MTFTTLVSDLSFPEGPRWRDGHLYYSDFYRHVVERVALDCSVEQIASVPAQPSGLGWLPDGRLLIVSMVDRKILRLETNGDLVEHADLSHIATFHCNDMVVDHAGRAYVGNFGFDRTREEPRGADLALVQADGTVSRAAEGLEFPNGSVITADGATLIVGETMGRRLTAFDIQSDGTLANTRTWANTDPHHPDGICLDAEGGIWIADPVGRAVVRVEEGGRITNKLEPGRPAYACMLGGEDGRQLFVCTGTASGAKAAARRDGRIEYAHVDIPHEGLP